jgi:hypothetical protein
MSVRVAQFIWLLIGLAVIPSAQADDRALVLPPDIQWSVKLPADKEVIFHGIINADELGLNAGGMVYPAPTPLGFLAAIATHAIILDGTKRRQLSQQQENADKVLLPYLPVIDKMDARNLIKSALAVSAQGKTAKIIETTPNPQTETIVESAPVFWMTADQESIIVDNVLSIRKPGSTEKPAYSNVIRVVSPAHNASAPQTYWMGNGTNLWETAVKLLAESIEIGLKDANTASADEKPFRTIRFNEGKQEKMERAQLLEERCGRMLLKTLRGSLMSVPRLKSANNVPVEASCTL